MYFLTPMCSICLKVKSVLNVINTEILSKLQYCIEQTEDYIHPGSNQTKICNDCLHKLNAAFDFKKMCLNNIVQFKDYKDQLEQVYNDLNPYKVITVKLTDINRPKRVLRDFNSKQYSNEQLPNVVIKEEQLDEINIETCENTEFVFLKEELQNQITNVSSDIHLEQQRINKQVEQVFIKKEKSNEIHLQPLESQSINPKEELKLSLHKEEILDDNHIKILDNQHKNNDQCYAEVVSNEETLFICATCGKHCTSKSRLIQHARIHNNLKPHSCLTCGKSFRQKFSLNRHLFFVHGNKLQYSCRICMKCFTTRKNLNKHVVTHSGGNPDTQEHVCSCLVCKESFTSKYTLQKHLKIHSFALKEPTLVHENKWIFSCSKCSKSFNNRSHLARHLVTHSKDKPHSCPVCPLSFKAKGSLTRHMATHSTEPLYSCTICKKGFNYKWILKEHMFSHSAEKPYSCSVCSRSFSMKATLRRHMESHSPDYCPVCKKRFTWKCNLKKHMLIHFGKDILQNVTQEDT